MISKADIKYIVSLQLKKQRQKYGQFVVEGEKSIKEMLKSRFTIDRVFVTPDRINEVQKQFKHHSVTEVSEKDLSAISAHRAPQGVLAIVNMPDNTLSAKDFKQPLCIGLDNLQDPGNLGTIIRIADWYGISTIICSQGCADVYNPKCINSTMGSIARVKVVYEALETVSEKFHLPMIAAVLEGHNLHTLNNPLKGMLIIGNEGHGIGPELLSKAAHRITIPRFGEAESLNAAVSTAIIIDNLIQRLS